jgi:hypothetical protein
MKQHVVIKFREPLADSASIPYWEDMIGDKSHVRESANAEIDAVMREIGLRFWLAHEYRPRATEPGPDEIRAGLDRTYRMISRTSTCRPGWSRASACCPRSRTPGPST